MPTIILTGASGSGKTAIASAIGTACSQVVDILHFDDIGVPSADAMVAGWGSGEAWQRDMTLAWMNRIVSKQDGQVRPILFEGQMRISFINQAMEISRITRAHIILVDCDDDSRARRLSVDRQQPELANDTMMEWAAYLRQEAAVAGIERLDTTHMSLIQCARLVCERLGVIWPEPE